jgi:two-component sensor histidine kinase
LAQPWYGAPRGGKSDAIDAVFIMVHNATEAVQKQRELNVKSAIIQEVHHRVKNNLQNIAAILRMQARRSQNDSERQNLLDAVNRVLSMSVIHEFLSHDEHRPINLRDLCHRIATQVVQVSSSTDKEVRVQVHGPSIRLPASQATPAAMVVNELMLNAVEHGLAGRDHGVIDIHLGDLGDAVELVIADDGNGLPHEFSPARSASLGLHIVQTLVSDDLKGHLHFEENEDKTANLQHGLHSATKTGTRAVVTFPKRPLGVD